MANSTHAVATDVSSPASTEARESAAASVMHALAAGGIAGFFGVPGGALGSFIHGLPNVGANDNGIHVLADHENNACAFAEGAARATGRVYGCYATAGPGFAQMVSALRSARANQVPLLVIVGEPPLSQHGQDPAQSMDAIRLLDNPELTKICERVSDPRRAAERAQHVLRVVTSGTPGPGALVLPADVANREVAVQVLVPEARHTVMHAIGILAEAVRSEIRCAILVGSGGASPGAGAAAIALAEVLNCPIATTARAKSAIPETHPLATGPWGFSSTALADKAIGDDAQVLVVVGSGGGELSTGGYDPRLRRKRIIQIDRVPERLGNGFPIEVGICDDARSALRSIVRGLIQVGFQHVPRSLSGAAWLDATDVCGGDGSVKPQRIMRLLNQVLPAELPVFVDIGNSMMWAIRGLVRTVPGTFHWDGHFGRMGHSMAGIGAAIATQRPAVILVGDAALKMVMGELHTAAESGARTSIIVLNDGGHGMVEAGLRQGGICSPGYRFSRRIDFASVGRALGCRACTIASEEDFARELPRAIAASGPTVLDVLVDTREVPPMEKRLRALRGETG